MKVNLQYILYKYVLYSLIFYEHDDDPKHHNKVKNNLLYNDKTKIKIKSDTEFVSFTF